MVGNIGNDQGGNDQAGQKRSILFVCDWNAVRSPMAELILNQEYHERYKAASAGVEAYDYIDSFVIGLMREEYGVSLINKEPRALRECDELQGFNLLIALSKKAYTAVKQLKLDNQLSASVEYWDVPPPPSKEGNRDIIMQGYRDLYDTIKGHIDNRFG